MGKKNFFIVFITLLSIMLTACNGGETVANGEETTAKSGETSKETAKKDLKVAFIVDKLGDNSANDETYSGIQRFEEETGIKVTTVEAPSLQDHEMNARTFAQEGYDLILDAQAYTSESYTSMAPEFPDVHFVIMEGTVSDLENVTCLRNRPSEAAYLVGVFCALMNEELGGDKEAAFVGGMRNSNLERSQYAFTAGVESVGGEATIVYVGNFTDAAKAKEIALQLYNKGIRMVHGFAGGAGMGVHQAAEAMGEGYFSLGDVRFDLSDSIIAIQVKNNGKAMYDVAMQFYEGELEGGIISGGLKEEMVELEYNPLHEDKIPQEIKDTLQELQEKIINGELVPPMTEEEYNAFQK